MSDTTLTETSPETVSAATPAAVTPAPSAEENTALRNALTKVQADYASIQGQLSSITAERDAFKATADKFEPLFKEAEGMKAQIQGFVNTNRETAIVETLRAKLPADKTPFEIRSAVLGFHEAGKANRHAEDAVAESAKLLKLIESEAPSLLRPATSGGGTPSARAIPAAAQRKSRVG